MNEIYRRTPPTSTPPDLDPTEAFVLARVDGRLALDDLSVLTGLAPLELHLVIGNLEARGLVEIGVAPGIVSGFGAAIPKAPQLRLQSSSPVRMGGIRVREISGVHGGTAPASPGKPRIQAATPADPIPVTRAPAKLVDPMHEPDVDLDPAQRERVLQLTQRAEQNDHYALFGVSRDADKKAIKRAYYAVAAAVHPDRFFRKRLGTFKTRMEVVFARLTEAHDTLIDDERRIDYDGYLTATATAAHIEAVGEAGTLSQVDLVREFEEFARGVPTALGAQPASPRTPQPAGSLPSDVACRPYGTAGSSGAFPRVSPPAGIRAPSVPPFSRPTFAVRSASVPPPTAESDAARREALARKLLGGRAMPGRPPTALTPPIGIPAVNPRASSPDLAVHALKERYEARLQQARSRSVDQFTLAASESLRKGDIIAAASALRVAISITPDDADLRVRQAAVQADADAILTEQYRKQATYEEKQGRFEEAARSYKKLASVLRTNGEAWERSAYCNLRSNGDLHDASDCGKKAVELDSNRAQNHLTLGLIYLEAGLHASARRAIDRAGDLGQGDAAVASAVLTAQKRLPKT